MERKLLALILGQFVVIGVLGVIVYQNGKTAAPSPVAEVSHNRERPARNRPGGSPNHRQIARAPGSIAVTTLPKSLDPAKAQELLRRNQDETKNLRERAEKAHAIIQRLCRNGHAKEAWELIESEYGLVRFRELEAFFQEAKLAPDQALARMDGLDVADRGSALKGYLGNFTADEFAALDLSVFDFANGRERAALIGNFVERLRAASEDVNQPSGHAVTAGLLERATRLTAENKLSLADLGSLLDLDKSQDSFAHWATVATLPESMKQADPSYDGVQAKLIREMTLEDPKRLMTLTMTAGAPEERFMHIALEKWLDADNASATQWYEGCRESLTVEQKDRATAAFLRNCLRYEEYENALKWYDSFVDPGWRSALRYAQRNALNGMKNNAATAE